MISKRQARSLAVDGESFVRWCRRAPDRLRPPASPHLAAPPPTIARPPPPGARLALATDPILAARDAPGADAGDAASQGREADDAEGKVHDLRHGWLFCARSEEAGWSRRERRNRG